MSLLPAYIRLHDARIRGRSGSACVLMACLLWLLSLPAAGAQLDIILILDNSGSMQKSDPQFLTSVSVRHFLDKLEGDARVGILAFDQDVRWALEMTQLSDEARPRFLAALDTIDYKGLFTNSPKALERAIYELKVHGRPGANRSIIFMTDGIVDTGDKARDLDKSRWMQEDLAAEAGDEGIRIYGIAFTEDADFQLIQALARRTDGGYFKAFAAADIATVFDRITSELDSAGSTATSQQNGSKVQAALPALVHSTPTAPSPTAPVETLSAAGTPIQPVVEQSASLTPALAGAWR